MAATQQNDLDAPCMEDLEIGHTAEFPSQIPVSNARELFGLREGETIAEAIARHWID